MPRTVPLFPKETQPQRIFILKESETLPIIFFTEITNLETKNINLRVNICASRNFQK